MKEDLNLILKAHQSALKNAWFDKMLDTYPAASRKFFVKKENVFSNPVGANLYQSLSDLLDELLKEEPDSDVVLTHLTMILRIKAVQDVLPSQAVSFVPALKQIIERVCAQELSQDRMPMQSLLDFYSDLDTVALLAFDVYSESRDLIYELRIKQIRETNDILVKAELLDQALEADGFMQCSSSLEQDCACSTDCNRKGV